MYPEDLRYTEAHEWIRDEGGECTVGITAYAAEHDLTIAVMGCRVNGPGETDDADLGLWCGPKTVNLKRGETSLGAYSYDDIIEGEIGFIGTPNKVIDQIGALREKGGIGELTILTNFGGLEHWKVIKTQELFAEQVMPAVR